MHERGHTNLALSDFQIRTSAFHSRRRRESVLRWLRTCAVCASTLPPVDVLCGRCWDSLSTIANSDRRVSSPFSLRQSGYPFPVYSLFTWSERADPWLKPLIHAMKGGLSPVAVERLATMFMHQRSENGLRAFENRLLVPAPATALDHAGAWAIALGEAGGIPVLDGLEKAVETRGQRRKKAEERSERRCSRKSGFQPSQASRFVFVDDVITTGSTAMAAYMALDDPSHFEVWTMVCRPRLAGSNAL